MKTKFLIYIFILSFVLTYCAGKTERERLETQIYDSDKYKTFTIEIVEKDFIFAKNSAYREILIHSAKILLGEPRYISFEKKIKRKINNEKEPKSFFLYSENKINSRERIGAGIRLDMRVTLEVNELINLLKKTDFTKFNVDALLKANNRIVIDNSSRLAKINSVRNYIKFFRNRKIGFIHNLTDNSLPDNILKKIYTYVFNSLNNVGINLISYDALKTEQKKSVTNKSLMRELNLDFIILFTENTSIKRLNSGYFKINSIIKLELFKKNYIKINSINLYVDQVIIPDKPVDAAIAREVIEKGITRLFLDTSYKLNSKMTYKLILKDFPSQKTINDFVKLLNLNIEDKKIIKRDNNIAVVLVKFNGSKMHFQNKILNLIEKENLTNKIYLINSGKKMIELKYSGVKIN